MTEYTLTEQEKAAVQMLRQQLANAEAQVVAVRGALQGAALMIGKQQGFDSDATVVFDEASERLISK